MPFCASHETVVLNSEGSICSSSIDFIVEIYLGALFGMFDDREARDNATPLKMMSEGHRLSASTRRRSPTVYILLP
jgi:hypothetical protein